MNYNEVIEYMYRMLPMYQRVGSDAFKKDLTNTILLCEALDNPQDSFKTVHIAGTNGKGSSSHMMAAVLQSAGYKTGLYTSPHLKSFTERIKINGNPIDETSVVDFITDHKSVIEEIKPSFFELTVAMSFYYFAINKVDIAVIEVGLGGRLDSTNIITPMVSLITNISLDHQDMLGNTLSEIAYEKAGIIKSKVPVVISERQQEVETVFMNKANEMHAPLYFAGDYYQVTDQQFENRISTITIEKNGSQNELSYYELRNPAKYQLKNIPGVLKSLDIIDKMHYPILEEHVKNGLADFEQLTGLKGRWQVLSEKPYVVADIGHNYGGLKETMIQLNNIPTRQLFIILGFVKEKKLDEILPLLPKSAYYYFCQPDIPRALDAGILFTVSLNFGLKGEIAKDVNLAYKLAMNRASDNDVIYIGGSTFVVAELINL